MRFLIEGYLDLGIAAIVTLKMFNSAMYETWSDMLSTAMAFVQIPILLALPVFIMYSTYKHSVYRKKETERKLMPEFFKELKDETISH